MEKREKLPTTTLPDSDDMLQRLMGVDQWPALMSSFYPALLEGAGATLNSHGIVMWILNGTHAIENKFDARISAPVFLMIPQFIDAVVDDKTIAEDAKQYWESLRSQFAAAKAESQDDKE